MAIASTKYQICTRWLERRKDWNQIVHKVCMTDLIGFIFNCVLRGMRYLLKSPNVLFFCMDISPIISSMYVTWNDKFLLWDFDTLRQNGWLRIHEGSWGKNPRKDMTYIYTYQYRRTDIIPSKRKQFRRLENSLFLSGALSGLTVS